MNERTICLCHLIESKSINATRPHSRSALCETHCTTKRNGKRNIKCVKRVKKKDKRRGKWLRHSSAYTSCWCCVNVSLVSNRLPSYRGRKVPCAARNFPGFEDVAVQRLNSGPFPRTITSHLVILRVVLYYVCLWLQHIPAGIIFSALPRRYNGFYFSYFSHAIPLNPDPPTQHVSCSLSLSQSSFSISPPPTLLRFLATLAHTIAHRLFCRVSSDGNRKL